MRKLSLELLFSELLPRGGVIKSNRMALSLELLFPKPRSTVMYESAAALSNENSFKKRSKHMDLRCCIHPVLLPDFSRFTTLYLACPMHSTLCCGPFYLTGWHLQKSRSPTIPLSPPRSSSVSSLEQSILLQSRSHPPYLATQHLKLYGHHLI